VSVKTFEQVVDEHGPAVLRVCRALLGPDDADDAWSETFLAALRAYPALRPDSNVRAWLVMIAHRKAIDRHRARARAPVPVGAAPGQLGQLERLGMLARPGRPGQAGITGQPPAYDAPAEPDTRLWDAVRGLPRKQRGAVAYHYLADLPYHEVGKLLGASEAAARPSAADGIAALRNIY
jgi:RNA polymerase sigma factor (sigma-70 family)